MSARREEAAVRLYVCVCTHNRVDLLQELLESLQTIELDGLDPRQVRLLVVDNNPTGSVRAMCGPYSDRLPIGLDVAEEPQRGISFARNKAVSVALNDGADFVAFIDDDDMPEPDWLLRLVEKQRDTDADIVFGGWRPMGNVDMPAWLKQTRSFQSHVPRSRNAYGLPKYVGTCNVLFRRGVLERLGADGPVFDPDFALIGGGDKDLFIRASKSGSNLVLADRSIINKREEEDRQTIKGALRRAFRNGCSVMNMSMKHGTSTEVKRKRNQSVKRLVLSVLRVPLYLFSKDRQLVNLYQISRQLGALFRYAGFRYKYYK